VLQFGIVSIYLVRNQQLVKQQHSAQAVINTYQGITAGIKLGIQPYQQ
jgi:hypothetical protein